VRPGAALAPTQPSGPLIAVRDIPTAGAVEVDRSEVPVDALGPPTSETTQGAASGAFGPLLPSVQVAANGRKESSLADAAVYLNGSYLGRRLQRVYFSNLIGCIL
jgi:hypothetical protein